MIDDDDRVTGFREKPRLDHWINGGFFCLRAGVPRLPRGRQRARARAARARRRRRAASAYRHDGFWDCMDTYKDAVDAQRPVGVGRAPPWARLGARAASAAGDALRRWSPGARGFVGAWLARPLLERGDTVVSFDRERRRAPGLDARPARDRGRGRGRVGDLIDAELMRRTLAEHGVDTRLPPRRRDDRRHGRRRRRCEGFESNVRGTWTLLQACRRSGVERVVVASSDKAYGAHDELPYREDFALQPTAPYEASKAAADLIARSYWHSLRAAGRGDPVREHLRRRRPQLLAADPGGGQRRARRPRAGAALRRLARARLPLRRGRRRAPTWRSPTPSTATRSAARRSTPAAGAPHRGRRGGRDDRAARRDRGRARHPRQRATRSGEIDRQYVDPPKLRETCGWEPAVDLEEGLRRTIEWYREHPEVRPPA